MDTSILHLSAGQEEGLEGIKCSYPMQYPPSLELFRQDEKARVVFCIEKGMVKLTRVEENGDSVIVGLRRDGWLLGVPEVILGRPYSVTAETLTSCYLCCIPEHKFKEILASNIKFSNVVNNIFSGEIYQHFLKIACMSQKKARNCVEQFLWDYITALHPEESLQSKPVKFQLPLKNWELARMAGITPEYLSRILKEMEKEKIIRRQKGWITVSDPQKLHHREST